MLAARFHQPPISALLHPLACWRCWGVQWAALFRRALGRPSTWARPGLPDAMKRLALLLALLASPAAAEDGVLAVTVTNVRNGHGHVLVAVCDRAHLPAAESPITAAPQRSPAP